MKTTFLASVALLISLLGLCQSTDAQMVRFTGSGQSINSNILLQESPQTGGGTTSIALGDQVTWSFDISTDGREVIYNDVHISFDGNVTFPNQSSISMDIVLDADVDPNIAYDLNPRSTFEGNSNLFEVEPLRFNDMSVTGTYHGLTFDNPFSASLEVGYSTNDYLESILDFSSWPNSLWLRRPENWRKEDQEWLGDYPDDEVDNHLYIQSVVSRQPDDLRLFAAPPLGCPCCGCGDFDGSGEVNGLDLLAWQLGGSPSPLSPGDLALWEDQYGDTVPPLSAISAAVPEPTTCTLALAALCLAMSRRRAT